MLHNEELIAEIAKSRLFDARFYRNNYQDVIESGIDPIVHFVEYGLPENRLPSSYFDPQQYLDINLDVKDSNQQPFLHYIRNGREEGRILSTEWQDLTAKINDSGLFDPDFYNTYYLDVVDSKLGPLDHYLRYGIPEMRRPSVEFDDGAYLSINSDVRETKTNALIHYVLYGKAEGRTIYKPLFDRASLKKAYSVILASGLFDIDYYVENSPVVKSNSINPIIHYILEGAANYHDPSPDFSSCAYMIRNLKLFSTKEIPLLHFIQTGSASRELPPSRDDVRDARTHSSDTTLNQSVVIARMETGSYFNRYGFNFEPSGPTTHIVEAINRLANNVPVCIATDGHPNVSIIIPVYGQMPFVLSCLDSLSYHKSRFSIEIIVADDKSPLEYQTNLLEKIQWIKYVRNDENVGFLENCNKSSNICSGDFIVLLNSDIRVVDNWLDELIGSFDIFPNAGFVGSKLLDGEGRLQEAGGIYWSDGTAWNYGRDNDERDPRYSFARQVDWVSGASIAIPTNLWREIGGFDSAFQPAYCEDVDLAFRIRERGYEVWYQPLSCALHFEGMTHGRDESIGIKAYQVTNLKFLQHRWGSKLPGHRRGGVDPDREANRSADKTMLVIDAITHTPDRDAGSAIGWEMLKAFREMGFQQTYVPLHGFQHSGRYTENYQRVGVEVLYAPFIRSFHDVINMGREFDYILTHRYNVTKEILDLVKIHMPTARIIFVPADLHYLRMEREAALKQDRTLMIKSSKAKTEELAVMMKSDCIIPHSTIEKEVISKEIPNIRDKIVVLPWIINPEFSNKDIYKRDNIMFLGGYNHQPNVDAVEFFIQTVWDKLVCQLPLEANFLAVGNAPPTAIQKLSSDRIIVTGQVPKVEPLFNSSRVFVAPLRYGAGVKGKVIQSLANGVPVVATSIAVEGIGILDEEHCLIANTPDEIANSIIRLYNDNELWNRLSNSGLRFIEEHFSWNTAVSICRSALDVADKAWMQREENKRRIWVDNIIKNPNISFEKLNEININLLDSKD